MPIYSEDHEAREMAIDIIRTLNDYFSHIDIDRVFFVRTRKSRSRAIARIHSLSTIWRYVLNEKPMYIIEVIDENFSSLDHEDKIKVLIHELLHIPKKFSGGLRPHGRYVNRYIVEKLYRIYSERRL
ncbi:conserved hypothetical protein [Ignisphaera aggregans DSM 17230]|uniref:Putative phage metallopeptidase domain-containing protein n=1 Tax=Ignisphaera aggregans (strain DSM 17230 / JCM 13409 / AQ1.S1) TaxID=583356 RepID=E0SSF1_IGNAA|nr:conserved hypothetical protein [Ignisphaera aggregans DSM 17230]